MWYKRKSFKIFIMEIWSDYNKVLNVIDSCKNIEQLKSATKMLNLWYFKYKDSKVYHNTYRNKIQNKFYKLGGINLNELPFEKN